jgi:adenylate cyclase
MDINRIIDQFKKSPPALLFTLALIGTLIGAGLSNFLPFELLELKSLDFRFRLASQPETVDTSVVLVAVDQNSMDYFAGQKVSWPWPREFYGLVVDYLKEAGARVIAFDFDFSTPDVDRVESDGAESDRAFADAMWRAGNVVLGSNISVRDPGDQIGTTILPRHLAPLPPRGIPGPAFDRAAAPLHEFQDAAGMLGATNFETDVDDIGRRIPPVYHYQQSTFPQFALACYALSRAVRPAQLDSVVRTIPTGSDGNMLIAWYGRGGPDGVFRYYSIHALIVSARKMKTGLPPDVPPELFRGKHVIVGGTAVGLWDYKPTPFTVLEKYSGMEIQATILSNLLQGHAVARTPWWLTYVLMLLLALAVALIFLRVRNVPLAATLIAALGLLFAAAATALFRSSRIWIPVVGPVLSLVTTFALAGVVSYAIEGQQKRSLRRAFNRYLSPQVVGEILHNVDQVELGGKTIEATVFFSDIKNFTNISEQFSPKDLVAFLNEYFTLASEVILEREAMLDKYIGDAIMAIFGAPIPRPDHARAACETALKIQRLLKESFLLKERDTRAPVFETRIGLNTGKMVVGNIGSARRLDYTAIGDTVNLASRLEGVNKVFGSSIIISEFTYEQAKEFIEVRQLDVLRVKGKQMPVRIYELLCEKGNLPPHDGEKVGLFEEGLELYRKRDFVSAITKFQDALALAAADHPSETYIARCRDLADHPPPEDWDGAYTMTTK